MYGLVYHHNIFSNKYKPQVNITIELYDTQKKIIVWANNSFITSYNSDTLEKTYNEFFQNPDFFKKAISQAFTIVTKNILDEFDE